MKIYFMVLSMSSNIYDYHSTDVIILPNCILISKVFFF